MCAGNKFLYSKYSFFRPLGSAAQGDRSTRPLPPSYAPAITVILYAEKIFTFSLYLKRLQ